MTSQPPPASNPSPVATPGTRGIDPRGPRFSAGITAVLLLVVIGLDLGGGSTAGGTLLERAGQPAAILFSAITVLFAWGFFAGVTRHPYGWLFRTLVRPRLDAPSHLEDPRPPRFSQGVGLAVTLVGLLLHLVGVPYALEVFAGAAFLAAFLNAMFDFCVGCQLYLVFVRVGIIRPRADSRA